MRIPNHRDIFGHKAEEHNKEARGFRSKVKDEWMRLYHSTHHNMSHGAEHIFRMIPYGRGENWWRSGGGKREHKK